jgi:hypothetical protein
MADVAASVFAEASPDMRDGGRGTLSAQKLFIIFGFPQLRCDLGASAARLIFLGVSAGIQKNKPIRPI